MARTREQYLADLKKRKENLEEDRLRRRERAVDMFRHGRSVADVRDQCDWGRGDGRLVDVQREAVKSLDVKAIADGALLNALELNRFGTRKAPADLPLEQLSILSIADGKMNGEGRFA